MTSPKIPDKKNCPESQFEAAELFDEEGISSEDIGMNENYPTGWLGLEIDHRRLFEAGQDGWLHPSPAGFTLGRECFVADPDQLEKRNLIPIRVVFEPKKFPLFGNGNGCPASREDTPSAQTNGPSAFRWLAPIPLYAISRLQVRTPEEKARVRAMANQLSNVCLPDADFEIGDSKVYCNLPYPPRPGNTTPVELPDHIDATHGAMAMSIWGVPHVEPWLVALQKALSLDEIATNKKVAELGVSWLQFPWFEHQSLSGNDENSRLWKAAVSTMRGPLRNGRSAVAIAESIARLADPTEESETTERWFRQTQRIAAAEETVVGPNANEVGLAIQLVLFRPNPVEFRTWISQLSFISPATLWAAAILCGWRHGYRALDKQFRGGATLREFLSTQSLVASWCGDRNELLPEVQRADLTQERQEGCYSLSWGNRSILRKRWK